uniref:Spherical body protein 2 truncated copy 12 (SBP2) n=1 Tax=Babesia bovis TaxID=5865 RepID=S6BI03_BABBO|nr:spherical body protein 2 truncated copy 12 (SBP2) [Babesia bovis]
MAITARNNGFRKVAKWIVGAVVVAGATSANVAAESHLQGAKKVPFYAPEAVVFVTSLGKEYTNQDIDNLVDCTDLECTGSVWRHEITRRRAELLYRMEKFDKLMQQLPSDLVTAAMMYHTFEMLPEQLAKDITRYVFNANYNNLIDELPEPLAQLALEFNVYEGIDYAILELFRQYLRHYKQTGKVFVPNKGPYDLEEIFYVPPKNVESMPVEAAPELVIEDVPVEEVDTEDLDYVIFTNCVGTQFTNRDLYQMLGFKPNTRSDIESLDAADKRKLLGKKAMLLNQMRNFNRVLKKLPADHAKIAGSHAVYNTLPEDLAREVKMYWFDKLYPNLISKLPEHLVYDLLKCDVYEGMTCDVLMKVIAFLRSIADEATIKSLTSKVEKAEI